MGTLTSIYVRVPDLGTQEALLAEYPSAYTETDKLFYVIDDPPWRFDVPEEKLQALSARLGTDVLWLCFQSVVDAFEFHHWRQGIHLRSLVFGCRGQQERTWERIEGTAEPWEETALADFKAPFEPGQFGWLDARETARKVATFYRLPGWDLDWDGT